MMMVGFLFFPPIFSIAWHLNVGLVWIIGLLVCVSYFCSKQIPLKYVYFEDMGRKHLIKIDSHLRRISSAYSSPMNPTSMKNRHYQFPSSFQVLQKTNASSAVKIYTNHRIPKAESYSRLLCLWLKIILIRSVCSSISNPSFGVSSFDTALLLTRKHLRSIRISEWVLFQHVFEYMCPHAVSFPTPPTGKDTRYRAQHYYHLWQGCCTACPDDS